MTNINLYKLSNSYKQYNKELTKLNIFISLSFIIVVALSIIIMFVVTNSIELRIVVLSVTIIIYVIILIILYENISYQIRIKYNKFYASSILRKDMLIDKLNGIECDNLYHVVYINNDDPYDVKLPYQLLDYNIYDSDHIFKINTDDYTEIKMINKDSFYVFDMKMKEKIDKLYNTTMSANEIMKVAKNKRLTSKRMEEFVYKLYTAREKETLIHKLDQEKINDKFNLDAETDSKLYEKIKQIKEEL